MAANGPCKTRARKYGKIDAIATVTFDRYQPADEIRQTDNKSFSFNTEWGVLRADTIRSAFDQGFIPACQK